MSQTDRTVAIGPAHTVSKADGTVYQVLELNTRQVSDTHIHAHTGPGYLRWTIEICFHVFSLVWLSEFWYGRWEQVGDTIHRFGVPEGATAFTATRLHINKGVEGKSCTKSSVFVRMETAWEQKLPSVFSAKKKRIIFFFFTVICCILLAFPWMQRCQAARTITSWAGIVQFQSVSRPTCFCLDSSQGCWRAINCILKPRKTLGMYE